MRKMGEKMEKKKKKKERKKRKDEESIGPDKRKEGGHWLHEKSCYGSWRFTRGDRTDWPPRNIAASLSQKGRFFRVKLALDDGTSPTFHAVTRMEKSLLHVAPFSYRGPSSLPASKLAAFSIFLSSGEGWTSFLSESMDGDGTWRDPLTSSVCSKNFLLCKSFLCMTIPCNLNLWIFILFQARTLPNFINISKCLDFQNKDSINHINLQKIHLEKSTNLQNIFNF